RLADNDVGLEIDAHLPQDVDLVANDVLGQAELWDTVNQHTADLVQGLEHGDGVSPADQVASGAQARRAAADDGDLLAGGPCPGRQAALPVGTLIVGHEAFQIA